MIWLAAAYLACGVVFAIPFLARGAAAIDPGAREGSWGFRLIVLPGVVALWPVLLRRWLARRGEPPIESNAHRRAAQGR
jgi:membrane protein implicated in regulation of membrane protease activity